MKKYITRLLLLCAAVSVLPACRETDKLPAPATYDVPLIIPKISSDPDKRYFDYLRTQLNDARLATQTNPTRPVFEFTIDVDNSRDRKVQSVDVYKSFRRSGVFGNRVLLNNYSSFPATISLTSQQALSGLQRVIPAAPPTTPLPYLLSLIPNNLNQNNLVLPNDEIVFTFEYLMEDGSRLVLTPVTSTTVGTPPNGTAPNPNKVDVLASTTQTNAPFAAVATIRLPL